MRTSCKHLLAAGAAVVATLAISSSAASALPRPPAEDAGGGSPSDQATGSMLNVDIRTDSVTATVVISYGGARHTAEVEWGDGTKTKSCPPGTSGPVSSGCFEPPFGATEQPGIIVVNHQYKAPPDGLTYLVTVRYDGQSASYGIPINPRYRVQMSEATFLPLDICESGLEATSEWRVEQYKGTAKVKSWDFEMDGLFGFPLAGSNVSTELPYRAHIEYGYLLHEKDWLSDEGLKPTTKEFDLAPELGSRTVTASYTDFLPGCRAEVTADISVTLIKPIAAAGAPSSTTGGGPVASL